MTTQPPGWIGVRAEDALTAGGDPLFDPETCDYLRRVRDLLAAAPARCWPPRPGRG